MRKLRLIRKEHKLSPKEVADLLEVSERAYHYYESGGRDPSLESVSKLEDLFGVSYREFMKVM